MTRHLFEQVVLKETLLNAVATRETMSHAAVAVVSQTVTALAQPPTQPETALLRRRAYAGKGSGGGPRLAKRHVRNGAPAVETARLAPSDAS